MIRLRPRWGDQAVRQATMIATQAIRQAETLKESLLDALSDEVAVIDVSGRIVAVNDAWKRFANTNGDPKLRHTGAGKNYLDICRRAVAEGAELAEEVLHGVEGVLNGTTAQFSVEYPLYSKAERRWFLLTAIPLVTDIRGAVISRRDITAMRMAQDALNLDAGLHPRRDSRSRFFPRSPRTSPRRCTCATLLSAEIVDEENGAVRLLSHWTGAGYGEKWSMSLPGLHVSRSFKGICVISPRTSRRGFQKTYG